MTMKQLSTNTDKKLHKLSRDIDKAEAQIKEGETLKDDSWKEVFDHFSEFGVEEPIFIADNGWTLVRQARQGSPKLDEAKLEQLLREEAADERGFNRLWNLITDRKVNSLKLEQAVQAGKVSAKILETAITMPPLTYARVRRLWSKEDAERAHIFGVEKREIEQTS